MAGPVSSVMKNHDNKTAKTIQSSSKIKWQWMAIISKWSRWLFRRRENVCPREIKSADAICSHFRWFSLTRMEWHGEGAPQRWKRHTENEHASTCIASCANFIWLPVIRFCCNSFFCIACWYFHLLNGFIDGNKWFLHPCSTFSKVQFFVIGVLFPLFLFTTASHFFRAAIQISLVQKAIARRKIKSKKQPIFSTKH